MIDPDKLRALDEAAEATMTRTMTSQESGALLAYLWDNRAAILAMAEREKRMREALEKAEQIAGDVFWNLPMPEHWDRDKQEYTQWCARQSAFVRKQIRALGEEKAS